MPVGVYPRKFKPLKDRLLAKIAIDPETQCWIWTGCLQPAMGHGQIAVGGKGIGGKRIIGTHRVSWMVHRGPIPAGLIVCHRCDNPPCVNPDHLFLGTKAENSRDMVRKGRQKRGEDLPQSKITDAQVEQIRAIIGIPQTQIAAMFGLAQSTVSQIRGGQRRRLPTR